MELETGAVILIWFTTYAGVAYTLMSTKMTAGLDFNSINHLQAFSPNDKIPNFLLIKEIMSSCYDT